jgi:hypothetical protein
MIRKRLVGRAGGRDASGPAALRRAPHVLATSGESRVILLDLAGGRYWGLDDVAAEIWSSLEAGRPLDAVVDELADRYDAPRTVLERDARAFAAELQAAGLVETS